MVSMTDKKIIDMLEKDLVGAYIQQLPDEMFKELEEKIIKFRALYDELHQYCLDYFDRLLKSLNLDKDDNFDQPIYSYPGQPTRRSVIAGYLHSEFPDYKNILFAMLDKKNYSHMIWNHVYDVIKNGGKNDKDSNV
jgi:hypothetical protein